MEDRERIWEVVKESIKRQEKEKAVQVIGGSTGEESEGGRPRPYMEPSLYLRRTYTKPRPDEEPYLPSVRRAGSNWCQQGCKNKNSTLRNSINFNFVI